MDQIQSSMEQKILGATNACVKKYGNSSSANRRIAEMGRVNSIDINLDFGARKSL